MFDACLQGSAEWRMVAFTISCVSRLQHQATRRRPTVM